jgi:glycosyltransferase involved in cell wall biosynthesis
MVARRALVVSDSPIARDPRVLKQIEWLVSFGFEVDTLGRGDMPAVVNGEHFSMPRPSSVDRVVSYLFLPNRLKYRRIIRNMIPGSLRSGAAGGLYDVVVLNEVELLPWFTALRDSIVRTSGHVHLDLHEFTPSQRSGLVYQLVFKRWRKYLISFIPSSAIDTRSVVAEGIADLFVKLFGFTRPSIIRNCPPYLDLPVSSVDDERIHLVHHGVASSTRKLDLLIDAMALVDDRFTLHFMLVGSQSALNALKKQAQRCGPKVVFDDPVHVNDIPAAINKFDAEVIFFPPLTENLRFVLPNKLFEAIQARLGIITGNSTEIVNVVNQYGNGVVIDGWSAEDLARGISSLTTESVKRLKEASDRAARELSSEAEKKTFASVLGI